MKFGKRLRTQIEDMLPEWRNHFLSYKQLKKRLKTLNGSQDGGSPPRQLPSGDLFATGRNGAGGGGGLFPQEGLDAPVQGPFTIEEEEFVKLLNEELKKFNTFFMGKEEDFVMRYDHLRRKLEQLTAACDADDVTECQKCAESVNDVRRDIVTFHGELVLLENYSSLNYTGLAKILKKHDKRTGMLLRVPYLQTALRQPFYTTEQLTKFMRWCEEKLQFLLGCCHAHDLCDHAGSYDVKLMEDSPVEVTGTMRDIYRSTVAALRSLQELRNSSTPSVIPMPPIVVNRARSGGSSSPIPPGWNVADSRGSGSEGADGASGGALVNGFGKSGHHSTYWLTDSDEFDDDDENSPTARPVDCERDTVGAGRRRSPPPMGGRGAAQRGEDVSMAVGDKPALPDGTANTEAQCNAKPGEGAAPPRTVREGTACENTAAYEERSATERQDSPDRGRSLVEGGGDSNKGGVIDPEELQLGESDRTGGARDRNSGVVIASEQWQLGQRDRTREDACG
ncbi:hypothetical protein CBR_g52290 [Chara braunii]|uniref:SPX domain-containing protein n=1 Tax=Chara braunii TaxID=69332 RepID=A0A388MA85_CHABU|nr:hypothetical protein CBR_g52290 [Chara braunii]|eukprot:GBG91403.1 hypothetical protein CBR_g52290 [Chara braunii]